MAMIGEDDRHAVSRMFRFVFDVVAGVAPGFQVIMTEHADINEEWHQNGVAERWRGGLALVPDDWPRHENGGYFRRVRLFSVDTSAASLEQPELGPISRHSGLRDPPVYVV